MAKDVSDVAAKLKRLRLDAEEAELRVRLQSLAVELEAKLEEKELLARTTASLQTTSTRDRTRMRELRGADVAAPLAPVTRK